MGGHAAGLPARVGIRWASLAAGSAALAAAVARFVLGQGELERMQTEPLVGIVWHALTYAMALFGAALLVTTRASRDATVAVAMLATAFFGGVVAIMAVTAGAALGDPFAYYPVFVLTAVALLCAFAAARA